MECKEEAGSGEKVMCVPMDYAKKDHLVMFCNGHGDIIRKPFSVKNTPEGIADSFTYQFFLYISTFYEIIPKSMRFGQ
jgi:hypothetical protein